MKSEYFFAWADVVTLPVIVPAKVHWIDPRAGYEWFYLRKMHVSMLWAKRDVVQTARFGVN